MPARRRDCCWRRCGVGPKSSCNVGTLAAAASAQVRVVVRPAAAGSITNTVVVNGSKAESNYTNDTSSLTLPVNASPAGRLDQ
jgi:hypothetical protein